MSWSAALNHGSAREKKRNAREEMRTGSGEKRKEKRKGERMRGFALERIFDFCKNKRTVERRCVFRMMGINWGLAIK